MKKILISIVVFALAINVFSQQDPVAEGVLDKFNLKTKNLSAISADIILIIDNQQEQNFTQHPGTFKLKGEKYVIFINDSEIYCDGKSRWVYMPDVEEVTVSEIDESDDQLMNNPFLILKSYKEKFKYELINELIEDNEVYYIIELHPFDLDQAYHTISLRISKNELMLKSARYLGKDGIHYLIELNNINTGQLNDSDFIFNIEKHPEAEIIDLRD